MRTNLVILLFWVITSVITTQAQETTWEVTIVQSGTRSRYVPGEKAEITPIYSLEIGNPGYREAETMNYAEAFGPTAINGTVYVRYPGNRELWYSVEFRRPKTWDEIMQYQTEIEETGNSMETSFVIWGEPGVPETILPPPFDRLSNEELIGVHSLIVYEDAVRLRFQMDLDRPGIETFLGFLGLDYSLEIHWQV